MRVYRCFLIGLIIATIAFGVWYCFSIYNEHGSKIDGTLVYQAFEGIEVET